MTALRRHNHVRPAKLFIVLFCTASLALAATLPDGTGRAETIKLCVKCHSLDQAISLRQSQADWAETLSKMVNIGAQGTDEDFNKVLNYLVKFYGTESGGTPATARVSAGTTAIATNTATVPNSPVLAKPATPNPAALRSDSTVLDPAQEWQTYGHDPGGMRFSPLTQISPQNVAQLKVAWSYHMRPAGFKAAPMRGPAVMEGRRQGGPVGDEAESPTPARAQFQFGSGFRPSEVTPLVIRGIMYVATPYSRIAAIEPTSGQELWSFSLPAGNPSTRGLEYWAGDGTTPPKSPSAPLTASSIRSMRKPANRTPHLATTA